jgi:hypothetical protein
MERSSVTQCIFQGGGRWGLGGLSAERGVRWVYDVGIRCEDRAVSEIVCGSWAGKRVAKHGVRIAE